MTFTVTPAEMPFLNFVPAYTSQVDKTEDPGLAQEIMIN